MTTGRQGWKQTGESKRLEEEKREQATGGGEEEGAGDWRRRRGGSRRLEEEERRERATGTKDLKCPFGPIVSLKSNSVTRSGRLEEEEEKRERATGGGGGEEGAGDWRRRRRGSSDVGSVEWTKLPLTRSPEEFCIITTRKEGTRNLEKSRWLHLHMLWITALKLYTSIATVLLVGHKVVGKEQLTLVSQRNHNLAILSIPVTRKVNSGTSKVRLLNHAAQGNTEVGYLCMVGNIWCFSDWLSG
ncbi:unnamed protein product [Darwinula stevensoni]|uniref:Uncharacterized protein n=1 Tax=Darwinula stevensoni TaxID=69355 RepID=A0A7R8XJL9_9CRUS|nr:unnamed protein product [Darwinula stevensoni]CAG0894331.1 unnamed protein product [Darwinula stevensoni]